MNANTGTLASFEVKVFYNAAHLTAVACAPGADWADKSNAINFDSVYGTIHAAGAEGGSATKSAVNGRILEVFTCEMEVVAGGPVTTEFNGLASELVYWPGGAQSKGDAREAQRPPPRHPGQPREGRGRPSRGREGLHLPERRRPGGHGPHAHPGGIAVRFCRGWRLCALDGRAEPKKKLFQEALHGLRQLPVPGRRALLHPGHVRSPEFFERARTHCSSLRSQPRRREPRLPGHRGRRQRHHVRENLPSPGFW